MKEAETLANFIDPILKTYDWGLIESSKVLCEHHMTVGKIQTAALGSSLSGLS
ncbi:MAG: hypothetical protein PHP30_06250 [Bacteroidales bacterium]|nr:hypothetical protein [Bacteroidales bacterium]MDD3989675.1 hypothetical protein [Bacteroidales bacterium]